MYLNNKNKKIKNLKRAKRETKKSKKRDGPQIQKNGTVLKNGEHESF